MKKTLKCIKCSKKLNLCFHDIDMPFEGISFKIIPTYGSNYDDLKTKFFAAICDDCVAKSIKNRSITKI